LLTIIAFPTLADMKIAVVDDIPNIRHSLKEKLNSQPDLKVLFTAKHGRDFLEQMQENNEYPDVVLMDIDMPVMDGINAIAHATSIYPQIKYLVLTVFDDDEKIFNAIKAGASGYLLKDDKLVNIVEALKMVTEYGGAPISPLIAAKTLKLLSSANFSPAKSRPLPEDADSVDSFSISKREKEILSLLTQGLDSTQIAEKLFLSVHTVRKHISNIYEKLHVCSRVQAVKVAIKHNWV
jgi:DNA-binding NarL/FixJ family response regulator